MSRGRVRKKQAHRGSFGELLCRLREGQHLSLTKLADMAGMNRSYITMLEEGERLPSPKVVRQLAGALGVHPIVLKLATGQIEFWDLYPVNLQAPPGGYSLSGISKEEEIKLLWFLSYLRSVPA